MDNLELIKDDGKTVMMPSLTSEENEDYNSLKSKYVTEEITAETVATVIIEKSLNMELPNYVLDFSNCPEITIFQKEALQTITTKKEIEAQQKAAIYIFNSTNIIKIGYGETYKLEGIIPLMRDNVFNKEIRVYRNVDGVNPLDELKSRDKTKIRLRL